MADLRLTLACGEYGRMWALKDETVKPEGIELVFLPLNHPAEIFWRMMRYQEFDISEMSASSFMIAKDKGMPFVGIPVFPARCFRHSYVFVRKDSGIKLPQDLQGKRVGTPEYQMTAGLWIRGFLQHDYNVSPSAIHWFTGGQIIPGREERVQTALPKNVQWIGPSRTLTEMLVARELDAIASPYIPQTLMEGPDAPVRRLFENYKQVEKDYYSRTKIYPIMHMVVVREALYKDYPWITQSLYKAFCESKKRYFEQLDRFGPAWFDLPWLREAYEETKEVLGEDLCPYGVEANRPTLEALTQYSFEQGLAKQKFTPEGLFAPNTFRQFAE